MFACLRDTTLLAGINAFLSFVNRVIDFVDRFSAITTFVGTGMFEIGLCLSQMIERRLHVRLVRSG